MIRTAMALICLICLAGASQARSLDNDAESFLADCTLLVGYDQAWCKAEQSRFIRLFQRALGRNYYSQRSVASCFTNGCDGAVKVNHVAACAWRLLILESGSASVNSIDGDNRKADCESLETPYGRDAVRTQADALMQRVYGKPLLTVH